MRRWVIGLIFTVAAMLAAIWLWQILKPSEVVEVRAKVLPVGFMDFLSVRDLNGDGDDELVVKVSTEPWWGHDLDRVFVVTMENGKLVAYPTPFTFAQVSSTGGKRLIGIVESGKRREVAVAEWLPKGEWKVEKLGANVLGNLTVAIGDWDGDGEDNTALVLKEYDGCILVFQKQQDNQWRKVKSIKVNQAQWIVGTEWGALIGIPALNPDIPLFLWREEWHLGQQGESIFKSEGDWDGDGLSDELLVRVSPDGKTLTMHLSFKSENPQKPKQYLSHQLSFADWKVCRHDIMTVITATDQLSDGRKHLLVLLMKSKPLTLRLMDYWLSPDRRWQEREIARWEVKGINPPVEILVGDSDEDGKTEIFVVETGTRGFVPVNQRCFWRLVKTNSGWKLQQLRFISQVWGFHVTRLGKRLWLWHWRSGAGFLGDDTTFEFGTFKVNGQWEAKWQFRSSTWSKIDDLNGDEIPEVLTFQGQVFPYPIFWWRTEGVWRKQNLVGSSLLRTINGWLYGPENFVFPECLTVARWEGKKWFVVIWKDGVVQAVTLKR